jgi:alkyl hydroperoxide reductase subunit AhpC
MKTVGDKIEHFSVVCIKPGANFGDDAFETITEKSFEGKWKVIVYYPKDFTFVCPTEIVAYDKIVGEFNDRDAVLMVGSTDNEFCKLAWKKHHEDLNKLQTWMFADTIRSGYQTGDSPTTLGGESDYRWNQGLIDQLGVFYEPAGAALRATFIVDPDNVIQHVTVNNLNVGRNPEETLRVLDALQTGEKCACSRPIGGDTI